MSAPSSTDVSTLAANTLAYAFSNTYPAAPFTTVGDDTLHALTHLLRLFTTSITPTVAPIPAATATTLLVVPSTRVLVIQALPPVVTPPALSPRVVPVSTPPLPHIISPEGDDPVTCRRYPLCSRPRIALSERGPHLITAAAHHRVMRPIYLHPTTSLANYAITTILQGCVNMNERVLSGLSPIM